MGKAKKAKKGKNTRHNPTNEVEVTEPERREIQILEQTASLADDEREIACHSAATLIGGGIPDVIRTFLDNGAIKALSARLLDTKCAIQVSAAGALRNLAITGGEDVCRRMVQEDTMTMLLAVLNKTYTRIGAEGAKAEEKQFEEDCFLMEQLLSLLLSLCENSAAATNIFTRHKAAGALITLLNPDNAGHSVALLSAQCLLTVTDSNPEMSEQLMSQQNTVPSVEALSQMECDHALYKVLAAGIMLNLSGQSEESVQAVLPVLHEVLQLDGLTLLSGLVARSEADEEDNAARKTWLHNMAAQRHVLEILANLTADKDGDDWEEIDETGADEGLDPSQGRGTIASMADSAVSRELVETLNRENFIPLVVSKSKFAPAVLHQMASGSESVFTLVAALYAVQFRAISLLGNLVLCFDLDAASAQDLWQSLMGLTEQANENAEFCRKVATSGGDDILEALTGALLALVRQGSIQASEQQVKELMGMASMCDGEMSRMNCVALLALLAQNPAYQAAAGELCGLFLESARDTSPWVVAEALNALFDVYAETDHNDACKHHDMVPVLQQIVPELKQLIKTKGKSMDRELLGRVDEARINLVRFIKYKQAQGL